MKPTNWSQSQYVLFNCVFVASRWTHDGAPRWRGRTSRFVVIGRGRPVMGSEQFHLLDRVELLCPWPGRGDVSPQ